MINKPDSSKARIRIVEVSDYVIANLLAIEGYPYLQRDDNDPVRFVGDDAAKRAVCLDELINTKIPVQLTLKEAFVLSELVAESQTFCKRFGIEDVGDKIDKAVFDRTHN